jgi:hypothetical protein
MMNAIPGKYGGRLTSPFLLAHGVGCVKRTWFTLFLLCYFNHNQDGNIPCSHNQSHKIDGFTIGRSPTSNALLVDSYRLDPHRLPSSIYPQLSYNGGMFSYLMCDDNPAMKAAYPQELESNGSIRL